MKTVPAIDYQDAKRIVAAIVEKTLHLQKAAVIAVADAHGELIASREWTGLLSPPFASPPTKPGRRHVSASLRRILATKCVIPRKASI